MQENMRLVYMERQCSISHNTSCNTP